VFLGLRTVIYPARDLDRTKQWFTSMLGVEPYFDEPFYVGYDVGGYELGLDPSELAAATGPVAYWGVPDADAAVADLLAQGADLRSPVAEVGGGIRVATVADPSGYSVIGGHREPALRRAAGGLHRARPLTRQDGAGASVPCTSMTRCSPVMWSIFTIMGEALMIATEPPRSR
jgi:predicted enzyme related to lactoylglutathione lyase